MKRLTVLLLPLIAAGLCGCATAGKKDLEMQGLKNQITALESEIQSKNQEIDSLKDALNKTEAEEKAPVQSRDLKYRYSARDKLVQQALKNAGYYNGSIDGQIGRDTREAIRAFQKANNLRVDGKVGRKTWKVLKRFLGEKLK